MNIFLIGRSGVGKTTVIMRAVELLASRQLAGFYTQELRDDGRRTGFRATTLRGDSSILAHVDVRSRQRVGRYGVDVAAFERLVLPELDRTCEAMLIDEIGKMECFSGRFVAAVRRLLDSDTSVIATVALKGKGFIAEVKARPGAELLEVTEANRNALPGQVAQRVAESC